MSEASAGATTPAPSGAPVPNDNKVYSIEDVLAAEAKALHGDAPEAKALRPRNQEAQQARRNLNADQRLAAKADFAAKQTNGETKSEEENKPTSLAAHNDFYINLNKLNSAALCCSGGGIRSATFCLGVIQAFANYDVKTGVLRGKAAAIARSSKTPAHQAADAAVPDREARAAAPPKPETFTAIEAQNSALGRFHYLSTVSGGGYIGSWLSSWRSRGTFEDVIDDLTSRPDGPDIEPPEISWLRAYSNYLTPQLGVTSGDSWAAVAILIRNLILNWFVVIPIVCFVLLLLKLIATGSVVIAHTLPTPHMLWFALLGALCLVYEQSFTNSRRPPRRADENINPDEWTFFKRAFIWAFLSAIFFTIFFSSAWFYYQLTSASAVQLGLDLKTRFLLLAAGVGAVIYALGWIAASYLNVGAFCFNKGWRDFFAWAASGLVYGALVGVGAYLFWGLAPYPATAQNVAYLLVSVILGVPWVLMAQLVGEIVFVGLVSDEIKADADREWLGRAAGWLAAGAVAWGILAFLVFAGGYVVEDTARFSHQYLAKVGGVAGVLSGIVTAMLGSSSKTPAKSSNDDQGSFTAIASNVVLALAGPIFVAVLIILLSVALDKLLIGVDYVNALATQMQLIGAKLQSTDGNLQWPDGKVDWGPACTIVPWLLFGLLIAGLVGLLASRLVNINRFSLHALYRNRLTRCYLGASNQKRKPDAFSGFDFDDNLCVHKLWPPLPGGSINSLSLFHVVNIALNVVSTKRLAWQERKAESFTVSPLHCGAAYLGFRPSRDYGGKSTDKGNDNDDSGLSLGTAMAISGAAVSPNMGYHSSPSLALLLTLFNVRLGWWLGNPGKAGDETYTKEGPKWAAEALLSEALGETTDEARYVYLSDGGHFENLGLYEMVRRRCRLIVVIDAGCDPDFAFEDLGNAVRKIYIDLGIRITFDKLGSLANRPSTKSLSRAVRDAAATALAQGGRVDPPGETPYHAIGVIHYNEADHAKIGDHKETHHKEMVENGYILYIKPAYHGSETNAGIRSYATANPEFPHETTADQWFTESQLESYRALGLEIGTSILDQKIVLRPAKNEVPERTLHTALQELIVQTSVGGG